MSDNRGEATKKIKERLERGPAYPKQLSDELKIPLSTVKHNLYKGKLVQWDLIKQLPDGRYVIKSYDLEEDTIKNAYNLLKKRLLRSPKPEEIAYLIQKGPGEARDLLFKYIPGYSEPTATEIETAAKRVWDLIFWGMDFGSIDMPDYDLDRQDVSFKSIDFWAFFGIEEYRPVSSEVAMSYLRECPEMKPRIISTVNGNKLVIEAVWDEEVSAYLSKFPQYGKYSDL